WFSFCLLPSAFCLGCGGPGLIGGGSSFIHPLMLKWTRAYQQETGVRINYQQVGSGAGVQQMIEKALDFVCTDAYLNEEQLQKAQVEGGEVIHLPLILGGVVPAYNLPGIEQPINFSGEVLADIFLDRIRTWNDPRLQALNPEVELPDRQIAVVH